MKEERHRQLRKEHDRKRKKTEPNTLASLLNRRPPSASKSPSSAFSGSSFKTPWSTQVARALISAHDRLNQQKIWVLLKSKRLTGKGKMNQQKKWGWKATKNKPFCENSSIKAASNGGTSTPTTRSSNWSSRCTVPRWVAISVSYPILDTVNSWA